MTTHSENTASISFPIEKVYEALSSNDYWNYEAKHIGDEPGEVNSFSAEPNIDVVLFEELPQSALPEAVRSMVSQALKLKRTVNFGPLAGGETTGTVNAEVKGAPVTFSSDVKLKGAEAQTCLLYTSPSPRD